MIQICAVGGFNEVGKNCTAVKIDDEVVILDLGLHLENYIKYTEEEDIVNLSGSQLMKAGAVPNLKIIDDWKDKVKAIVIGHGHLDHVGAVPFLANNFKVPVIATPYTISIVKEILHDEKIQLKNKLVSLNPNSTMDISENLKVEFIHITHSIPQTVVIAIHTKYGIIMYANDFKLDLYPTFGKKPNFKRLKEISNENVLALVCEATYADDARKMPSESVAKEMLKDVLLGVDTKNRAILVTTFSSHIARLRAIIEFGKKLNRKILFLGRSLTKYVNAAENINLVSFTKEIEMVRYSKQIKRKLKKISNEREKYLLVVTGHQGEPKSVLTKIINKELEFDLHENDLVVFSCKTIPTPTNLANREKLEKSLKNMKVRFFKDIHQSGHAAREDLRDMISLVKPRKLIPAHGNLKMKKALASLAVEMGYELNKSVLIIKDSQRISI